MSAAPLKVLVVDDEPPIRKLLRMGLATQGYEILEAPNGKAALEMLPDNPDIVILDLGLPDIEGHELLRTIRSRNDKVPIVVLSSRGDEAGKVMALDFGADDYVTKPFGMGSMTELASNWRDGRIKQALVARTLGLRRSCPELFANGSYEPIEVRGVFADRVIAFARRAGSDVAVVVVPRVASALLHEGEIVFERGGWRDTSVVIDDSLLTDVLDARTIACSTAIPIGDLFARLPVALLASRVQCERK